MRTTLFFTFLLINYIAFAQQKTSEAGKNYFNANLLEEKIRNPHIREAIEKRFSTESVKELKAALENKQEIIRNKTLSTIESEFTEGAEPHIAIHPTNNSIIALSYMLQQQTNPVLDFPIYYTTDGGDTWTKSSFSPASKLGNAFSGHSPLGGGDPILAFDKNGTLHFTWLYAHGNQSFTESKMTMFYASSSDFGATFQVPSNINDHIIQSGDFSLFGGAPGDVIDREWLAVDNTSGVNDGNVYMSAVYFGGTLGPAGQLVYKKTKNSTGFNDNNPVLAIPANGGDNVVQFGNVQTDDNGTLHIAGIRFSGSNGAGNVVYTNSTDGAKNFNAVQEIASASSTLPSGGGISKKIHDRENSANSLAVGGDNVYISWSDMSNNVVKSYYAYSNDGGNNWSAPVEFGTQFFSTGKTHLMPNVAADENLLAITWYVVDDNNKISDYYMTISEDGGITLSDTIKLSNGSSDFSDALNSGGFGQPAPFYGDYNTGLLKDGVAYSSWSDSRNGNPTLYFAKTEITGQLTGLTEHTPISGEIGVSSIYPNPIVNGRTTVQLALEHSATLQFDLLHIKGQKLLSLATDDFAKGTHSYELDLAQTSKGIYLLRIADQNGTFITRKLVVN